MTGESYGGHYIPNTAKAVLDANEKADEQDKINLVGFAVGNSTVHCQPSCCCHQPLPAVLLLSSATASHPAAV